MAIKMRNNKDPNSVCCECGDPRKEVLDMFDVCIGGNIFTICDRCNEVLLNKTLCAECNKNARVKTPEDRRILRRRADSSDYKAKWQLEKGKEKLKGESK